MANRLSRNCYWTMRAGLGCLLALAVWLDFVARSQHVVFHEGDSKRIRIGMTRAEVQHELGSPPGDYTTDLFAWSEFPLMMVCDSDGWVSDEGEIRVWFDDNDRVEQFEFRNVMAWKRPWFQRLRGWFGI
jgi:hypothetical protein